MTKRCCKTLFLYVNAAASSVSVLTSVAFLLCAAIAQFYCKITQHSVIIECISGAWHWCDGLFQNGAVSASKNIPRIFPSWLEPYFDNLTCLHASLPFLEYIVGHSLDSWMLQYRQTGSITQKKIRIPPLWRKKYSHRERHLGKVIMPQKFQSSGTETWDILAKRLLYQW